VASFSEEPDCSGGKELSGKGEVVIRWIGGGWKVPPSLFELWRTREGGWVVISL